MRFAISLLSVLAIASVIGTVLKQNEPMPNYVNQFGPFWFDVFDKIGLYAVYSAWWFLLILGFLVTSTSLCIVRNAPRMLRDMVSWRENLREQSLRNFHHKAEWREAMPVDALVEQSAQRIRALGYRTKLVQKDGAMLIAAKRGAASKWGYILAHSAIVIICIGGLLDSDLPIRLQQWMYGKTPYAGSGLIADVPAQSRLGLGNPTFRGNTLIPEGAASDNAIIPRESGVLIQPLPFTIRLNRFIIEYYSTGMPKLFASEVQVTDHDTGKSFPATIKVNQPLIHKGLAVYQSSFEDGGSKLKLTAYPMTGPKETGFNLDAEVGGSTAPNAGKQGDYTIEWSGFRAFNVENMTEPGQDVRAVSKNHSLADDLGKQLGSAAKNVNKRDLRNVGPSVQYKLRDKTGQAREYHNYMQPVRIEGEWVFLSGMRESPNEAFRYLRIPADDKDSLDDWMRFRAALQDPQLRAHAAERYAQRALPGSGDTVRTQLRDSANKGLDIFAGNGKEAGYIAVARFLERLPQGEQEKAADIFMKILNGSLWEVWQLARDKDGLPPVAADEKHGRFLQLATNAYSDAVFYGAPFYLHLDSFEEVKASVLQVTRSPGKKIVYFGCLLLVAGIFAMLYVRERRLWVWIKEGGDGAQAMMAMSTQRRTLDFDREAEAMRQALTQGPPAK
ncbi:cytochrome c biogenesis protein ResB [Noviherbaspirillum pedocola]|uniref:Cytochrome c biogenesis protein ResB n=1 Tax=Noviherbaspirillum pedocola TaxID=2801341 RepID=A0A934W6S7_9BURK|nr:cytochrome c biogenesis protein ResB [Noviherbaspirillum pedocola]MBK4733869.1 cytochrome c biogenesis protein ResB [Noviherbaspirillum pedocola]